MKRAVILHGTDANPELHWFPGLKKYLEDKGYEVWVPELPNNHTPNRKTYNDFLFNSDWDFTDNLVVGHSSGAVSVLNLLEDERCPQINTGVMVAAWSDTHAAGLDAGDYEKDQFSNLFPPEGFNFELIKQKAKSLIFFHGDDDSVCPLDQAKWLAQETSSPIIIVPKVGHLSVTIDKFPQLIAELETRGWI